MVQQWPYYAAAQQQFVITDLGTGYYRISPTSSPTKALDVNGNSTANGASIIQWTYGGGNNQQWQLVSLTGGYYQIKSRSSGKCMDVAGVSTADGALVNQYTCGAGYNQQFTITRLKNASTSMEKSVLGDVVVSPNPSDGTFKIDGISNGLLQIFDLKGTLLLTRNIKTMPPWLNRGYFAGCMSLKQQAGLRWMVDAFFFCRFYSFSYVLFMPGGYKESDEDKKSLGGNNGKSDLFRDA